MRKFLTVAALTGALLATGASGAFASGVTQANGQGQTPLSASLGFNAKSNLTGSLKYNADPNGPNSGFSAHCNDYFFYRLTTTKAGFPRVKVRATCTDQEGNTVYLLASFLDRGEPGLNDEVCVVWNYHGAFLHDAFIHDMGIISNGNIQIHAS